MIHRFYLSRGTEAILGKIVGISNYQTIQSTIVMPNKNESKARDFKFMSYTAKDRIQRLERALDNWVSCMFRHTATMEKLGEQLAEIQCEVTNLKRLAKAKSETE